MGRALTACLVAATSARPLAEQVLHHGECREGAIGLEGEALVAV